MNGVGSGSSIASVVHFWCSDVRFLLSVRGRLSWCQEKNEEGSVRGREQHVA